MSQGDRSATSPRSPGCRPLQEPGFARFTRPGCTGVRGDGPHSERGLARSPARQAACTEAPEWRAGRIPEGGSPRRAPSLTRVPSGSPSRGFLIPMRRPKTHQLRQLRLLPTDPTGIPVAQKVAARGGGLPGPGADRRELRPPPSANPPTRIPGKKKSGPETQGSGRLPPKRRTGDLSPLAPFVPGPAGQILMEIPYQRG
jgi:hypothetical protein